VTVTIRDAGSSEDDRQWIESIYPEYLDDLTRIHMNTGMFPVSGDFGDRQPDLMARWFADDRSHPLVILKDGERVGIALVSRPLIERGGEFDFRMSEFFVLRRFRRLGVGRDACQLIFNRFSGRWEVGEFLRNEPAVAFWRRVISEYSRGQFREWIANGEVRQRFRSLPVPRV
jgi:predicted acetyltransferase